MFICLTTFISFIELKMIKDDRNIQIRISRYFSIKIKETNKEDRSPLHQHQQTVVRYTNVVFYLFI